MTAVTNNGGSKEVSNRQEETRGKTEGEREEGRQEEVISLPSYVTSTTFTSFSLSLSLFLVRQSGYDLLFFTKRTNLRQKSSNFFFKTLCCAMSTFSSGLRSSRLIVRI